MTINPSQINSISFLTTDPIPARSSRLAGGTPFVLGPELPDPIEAAESRESRASFVAKVMASADAPLSRQSAQSCSETAFDVNVVTSLI